MFKTSSRIGLLKQSGIRAASTRCASLGGINLSQGISDLPTADSIKQAAYHSINDNKNTYSTCEGILPLRQMISAKIRRFNQLDYDPHTEVMVTHGATGAFVCATQVLFNPGDEVILFEPFYGYHHNILSLAGVTVKTVPIDLESLTVDYQAMDRAVTSKTKAIVVCTPNNPTGKVYSKAELMCIGEFARAHNLCVITDEIYEYVTYPGFEHVSLASLADFRERTITISGFSKTYNMTGWRMGYMTGPQALIEKMTLVQDLLYVCPVTPLQYACLTALELEAAYYSDMQDVYLKKRDTLVNALRSMGFKVATPQGAYYVMADFSALGLEDDEKAVHYLLEEGKVATVGGRAFYQRS